MEDTVGDQLRVAAYRAPMFFGLMAVVSFVLGGPEGRHPAGEAVRDRTLCLGGNRMRPRLVLDTRPSI